MSERFEIFNLDIFPIILAFKKLSSTDAEKPLLEIPALAASEATDDIELQDESNKNIKENLAVLMIFSN